MHVGSVHAWLDAFAGRARRSAPGRRVRGRVRGNDLAVDQATAAELGLSSAIPATTTVAPTTTVATTFPTTTAAPAAVLGSADQVDRSGFGTAVWWVALPIVAGLGVFARRRSRSERRASSPSTLDDHEPVPATSERA